MAFCLNNCFYKKPLQFQNCQIISFLYIEKPAQKYICHNIQILNRTQTIFITIYLKIGVKIKNTDII